MSLLAVGLQAATDADGARRALSVDGRVEIVLRDRRDGRKATLRELEAENHRLRELSVSTMSAHRFGPGLGANLVR